MGLMWSLSNPDKLNLEQKLWQLGLEPKVYCEGEEHVISRRGEAYLAIASAELAQSIAEETAEYSWVQRMFNINIDDKTERVNIPRFGVFAPPKTSHYLYPDYFLCYIALNCFDTYSDFLRNCKKLIQSPADLLTALKLSSVGANYVPAALEQAYGDFLSKKEQAQLFRNYKSLHHEGTKFNDHSISPFEAEWGEYLHAQSCAFLGLQLPTIQKLYDATLFTRTVGVYASRVEAQLKGNGGITRTEYEKLYNTTLTPDSLVTIYDMEAWRIMGVSKILNPTNVDEEDFFLKKY